MSCAVWIDLKPLPPINLGLYKQSMSLFQIKFEVMFNILRVLMSISLTSRNVQSSIPKVDVNTSMAKQLWAICLLNARSSDFHILPTLLKYSSLTLVSEIGVR